MDEVFRGNGEMRKEYIEARLLYTGKPDVLSAIETDALCALTGRIHAEVEELTARPGDYIQLAAGNLRLLIAWTGTPIALSRFEGITRPPEDMGVRRGILRRLADHESSLTVVALDRTGASPAPAMLKRRLVWEVVDYLLSVTEPDLVLCPGLDRIMTATEAEDWLMQCGDRLPDLTGTEPPCVDIRRQIFAKDPDLSPEILGWLDAADEHPQRGDEVLGAAIREFLDLDAAKNAAKLTDTAAGRSAAYVICATAALFALPLGAAALSYNALSGGSLRASGYAMAAAGVHSALEDTVVGETVRAALALIV